MTAASAPWFSRAGVDGFVHSKRVQNTVIVVILINAVILGVETVGSLSPQVRDVLHLLDALCLGIFVVEIGLKLYAQGWRFFTSAWNVFDFIVIAVALVPSSGGFAVLRALRVLRVLRLISVVPALRRVVDALVRAIPGIASIALLLAIIFYVGAVMATTLFGKTFPVLFGDLGASLFSLFQIMTLDNWSVIVRDVTVELPWAPWFFIPFVLISALTVLNLFIAVIVDAMQGLDETRVDEGKSPLHEITIGHAGADVLTAEVAALREQVAELTAAVKAKL